MAQRIPQEMLEDIRTQTNIVEIVGQYVQLKKSGKNYFGLCPFHEERSPSFSVVEDKQIFYCFGCGKGGNVFKFLQELEGLSFPESVKKVAEIGNISTDLSFVAPAEVEVTPAMRQRQELLKLHETAADIYHHVLLNTEAGEEALHYLKERGMTEELIKEFEIGYAPKERILLQKVFERDNISDELLAESGLMTERDEGFVDRFYQRIMFPIRDDKGKTVAFSGRVLPSETVDTSKQPKYLNSPETPLFNKRQVLFNFDKAKAIARKEQELILFEGFMDVIASWRAGVKQGVASMGTSLTNEQINMIKRQSKNVVIAYDGDSAGIEATHRAIELLSAQTELGISILSLPGGLDPDDFIKENGEERYREIMKNGRESPFSFYMRYHQKGRNMKNEQEKFAYIEMMVKELAKIPSVIEREVYITQLSEEFSISPEAIESELQKVKQVDRTRQKQQRPDRSVVVDNVMPEPPYPETFEPPYGEPVYHNEPPVYQRSSTQVKEFQERPLSVGEKAEQFLLYRIMHERGVQAKISQIEEFAFIHDEYQELYHHFNDYMMIHSEFEEAAFLDYLREDHLKNKVVQLSYQDLSDESSEREINDYLLAIRRQRLEVTKQEKLKQQKEASRQGNKQLEQDLTIEIINLQRDLKSLR